MRIRQRLALSDLHLRRSETAPPPDQPSDQSIPILNEWVLPKTEEKMKQKENGDETLRMEANKSTHDHNNDIRRIVNICDGGEGFNTSTLKSQSFPLQESCGDQEDYKVVPLKKRRGSFERTPHEERVMSARMKSKTNKKSCDHDQKPLMEENGMNSTKKSKRGNVIMEGSRCSRVNGRGWRCYQPTLVGYSLCDHHLGKGRLRSGGAGGAPPPLMVVTKKRTKVGVVKARSMSSLLSQI